MKNTLHGLSANELQTILQIAKTYKDKIDRVGVFGSRANGEYKTCSDIDLVFYGTITERETDKLNTLFDESSLGLKVDVKNYQTIQYLPLKKHINSCVKTLFNKQDLTDNKTNKVMKKINNG